MKHKELTQQIPESLEYELLGLVSNGGTSKALVFSDFLQIPLHVQAECRRLSYLNHYPKKVGKRGIFPQFHRYDPDSEQVLGIFGDIGPHRDGPVNGGPRLTAGLVLVNDGAARLATGQFTTRGKPTERTYSWPLPVGSLYLMDSSQEHTTLSEHHSSLLAFAAFDFEPFDAIPTEELRQGLQDTLRRIFGYETDQIQTRWAGGTDG